MGRQSGATGRLVGELLKARHYNAIYRGSEHYRKAAADAPWAALWYWVLGRVGDEMVVDYGCGPGHLAELLAARGHPPHLYAGIDFSGVAIKMARERVPKFRFRQLNVIEAARAMREQHHTAVCCELLEHLDRDLALLRTLPPGGRVLATVPTHDSAGHVRHFPTLTAACARYERVIDVVNVVRLGRCYGLEGYRRVPLL